MRFCILRDIFWWSHVICIAAAAGGRREGQSAGGGADVAGDRRPSTVARHFGRGGFGVAAVVVGAASLGLETAAGVARLDRREAAPRYELIKAWKPVRRRATPESRICVSHSDSDGETGTRSRGTSGEPSRLFEITRGRSAYWRENEAALTSALARMDMAARAVSGEAPRRTFHHAMHTLKAALMFHRAVGTQKNRAR